MHSASQDEEGFKVSLLLMPLPRAQAGEEQGGGAQVAREEDAAPGQPGEERGGPAAGERPAGQVHPGDQPAGGLRRGGDPVHAGEKSNMQALAWTAATV